MPAWIQLNFGSRSLETSNEAFSTILIHNINQNAQHMRNPQYAVFAMTSSVIQKFTTWAFIY